MERSIKCFGIRFLGATETVLSNRQLVYNTSSGPMVKQITSGAAQGSILGPDLWNVSYDGILREDMPEGTFLVGYADDIAAVITARNTEEAQRKLRRLMLRTKTWLDSSGLDLAMHKTELLLITGRRIPLHVDMSIGNEVIRTKSSVKYLGIRLDPRLTFSYQIQYSANKAQKIVGQLSRLMANIGGPLPARRRLLMEVGNSIMLYGSEIWAETLDVKKRANSLVSVQRTAASRIASAYRTVSAPALLVIAGTIPVDLLAAERMEIYKAKSAGNHITGYFRENTISKWQQRWNEEDRGRWTAKLIPDIRPWIGRKFGEVNYYVTQMLSGHGYFRKYLHRMGKTASPYCLYEEGEVIDDAEHTVFECARWQSYRSVLTSIVGTITAANIVGVMIASSENWTSVVNYVERILRRKKRDLEAAEQIGMPA